MKGERTVNFGGHILVRRYSGVILGQLDRVFNEGTVTGLDDDKLLKRFVVERDEVAFAALVARHGRMVLGVCRRILHAEHDVEDAFQATFLVVVRRAKAIHDGRLLGHWIYGVAHRVAVRARANAARRYVHEQTLTAAQSGVESPSREGERSELRGVLDEELARLPELLRVPLVLCYLEGLTHEEAAERLRWPVGTVRSRLARGRDKLRSRLTRRGLTADDATLTATFASQPVSSLLLDATVRVSLGFTTRQAKATALASATATALAKGVLHAMMISKLKFLGAVTLACVFAWGGVRTYALQSGGAGGVVVPARRLDLQGQADDRRQAAVPVGGQDPGGSGRVGPDQRGAAEGAERPAGGASRRGDRQGSAGADPGAKGVRRPAGPQKPNPVSRPAPSPASTPNPGGPAGNLPKTGVAGVVDPARDFARGGGGGMGGTTMRGTGMGGASVKDRPRYIRNSQLIVVSSPEGDTVTAYSTETGKAKFLRLAKASDTKLEVQPIVSQGLAALYLKGRNITRIGAFSVLDGTWYVQDLREPRVHGHTGSQPKHGRLWHRPPDLCFQSRRETLGCPGIARGGCR